MSILRDSFINDLSSKDKLVRELALMQLGNEITDPTVLTAIEKAYTSEVDPFLKNELKKLIELSGQAKSYDTSTEVINPNQTISERWLNSQSKESRRNLLKELKSKAPEELEKSLIEIFSNTTNSEQITPLLSLAIKKIKKENLKPIVTRLLSSSNPFFLYRMLLVILSKAPQLAIKKIPEFLQNPNFYIKLTALRLLHKVSPNDSIKLLEKVIVERPELKTFAASALLLFPFNHVSRIIINLIDKKQEFSKELIQYLIENNPDENFLDQITILDLRKNQEDKEIEQYRYLAAKALIEAEIINSTIPGLLNSSTKKAAQFLKKNFGLNIESKHQNDDASATPTEYFEDLKSMFKQATMSPEAQERFLAICSNSDLSNENRKLICRIIRKFNVDAPICLSLLEEFLKDSDPQLTIQIIKTQNQLTPDTAFKTLEKFANSTDKHISSLCLMLLFKSHPQKLAKMISQWIESGTEKNLNLALSSMIMAEISFSRKIIFDLFRKTANPELIDFFSPILLISPEARTALQLKHLAKMNSGLKKEKFETLLIKINKSLDNLTDTTDTSKKLIKQSEISNFDDFLENIRTIGQAFTENGSKQDSNHQYIILLLLLCTFLPASAFYSWQKSNLGISPINSSSKNSQPIVQSKELPSKNSKLQMQLLKYDPTSKMWSGKSSQNSVYKLILKRPKKYSRHNLIEITVEKSTKTFLGNVLIFARKAKKLN